MCLSIVVGQTYCIIVHLDRWGRVDGEVRYDNWKVLEGGAIWKEDNEGEVDQQRGSRNTVALPFISDLFGGGLSSIP